MAGILDGVDQRTKLAGHNRLELLLFSLSGRQHFGINVFKVQEVIRCPELTQIPASHPVVKGVANMRGKHIAVMDLSMAIGGPSLGSGAGKFVIITEYNRRIQGFLVGQVDRIVNMNWSDILPPPRGGAGQGYMTAVTEVDKELVEIIDVEKVLKEVVGGNEDISAGIIDRDAQHQVQHVLVADDSAVARNQVKRVLDQLGVAATVVSDGQQAWEQLLDWIGEGRRLEQFLAMIISDVEMPRMDGYTLTAEVRKHPDMANLHVILHTSLSGVFNEAMVRQVGADQFLAKYEPDELAAVVQQQLKNHLAQYLSAA